MCKDNDPAGAPEVKITPEMIEAGENVILCEVGGSYDLGPNFSAPELAERVYRAMAEKIR